MDYNPYLQSPRPSSSEEGPEKGNLEQSDGVENIIHQTRNASPTAYEDKLGQALEKIFDEGTTELVDIIKRLNLMDVEPPDGSSWTEEVFCSEMERLGA